MAAPEAVPTAWNAPARAPLPAPGVREAPAPQVEETGVGIAEFGAILRRRWKVIAGTMALTTVLGLAFTFIVKPIYAASTSIFVDPRNRAAFQIEGTGSGAGFDPNLVDSQSLIIGSETVLRRVIETERLLEDSEFTKGIGDAQTNAMQALKKAIKVKRPERTYVVEIEVRTQDADKSARIANAVARAYLSDGRDSKSETARREASWLETHIGELQTRLKSAEEKVEAFKLANRILGVDGKLVGEQRLSELNRSIVEAQRRTTEAKATLDQVELIRKSGKIPEATGDALKSAAIDRLRGQMADVLRLDANSRSTLGPRHPASIEIREQLAEARRQLNDELNRIAEGAKNAHAIARANEAALEKQIDALKNDANSTNQTLVRLRELERAVDAQKAVYQKFLSDKEQIARLSVDTPAGRVIAPASAPLTKAFPNRILILILALAGGGLLGVALALALETLAGARGMSRQHAPAMQGWAPPVSPAETEELSPLALLPMPARPANIRWMSGHGAARGVAPRLPLDHVLKRPDDAYSAAIDALRARLSAMLHGIEPATLLISGLEKGVGATTLAGNLAFAFASEGRSVALVDANPGKAGLTPLALATARTRSIRLLGREHEALIPLGALATGPFIIPFEARRRMAKPAPVGKVLAATLILIDGPEVTSDEIGRLAIDRAIDGVIVALPAHVDPADPALATYLRERFGDALIGTVARAA